MTVHDPEKAAAQIKAQDKEQADARKAADKDRPGRRRQAASASATSVHPPSISALPTPAPAPAPPPATAPPPNQPPDSDDDEDAAAIAGAVYIMEAEYDSLSDDETGLCEHPAIPARASWAEWTQVGDGRRARPTSVPPRPIDPGISPAPGK